MDEKSLYGKTVAVTGCTGGLGRELCYKLACLGANIIMLDRNQEKSEILSENIEKSFSQIKIIRLSIEQEDICSVKEATQRLIDLKPDIFIANAGAYCIPRHICNSGYDNIFQINFVSPYFMARTLAEKLPQIKIVAVGSIAHTYSKIDDEDIDFRTYKGSAKAYGNSKRYLMLGLGEYFKNSPERLAVVHPGITFTNITAHYPKLIFAVIKHPMKIIFMKPKKAAECILAGVFDYTPKGFWIGPRFFGIWGRPRKQKLKAALSDDSIKAATIAENIYIKFKTLA